MDLSSPYLTTTWTRSVVADTVRRVVADHRRAVGARLREIRKAKGLSQEDAAHAVGVSVKTWGDWERGRRDPYDSNWRRIGETFAIDPAEVRGTPPEPLGLGADRFDAAQLDRIEGKLDELLAGLEPLLRVSRPREGDTAGPMPAWVEALVALPAALRESRAQRGGSDGGSGGREEAA